MTSHEILSILNTIPTFEQLDDSHLEWMIGLGEVSALKTGEYLFRKGDPVEKMYILLEGSIQFKAEQGKQLKDIQLIEKGEITGILPYSRMQRAMASVAFMIIW